jgi:hypothetical protein
MTDRLLEIERRFGLEMGVKKLEKFKIFTNANYDKSKSAREYGMFN